MTTRRTHRSEVSAVRCFLYACYGNPVTPKGNVCPDGAPGSRATSFWSQTTTAAFGKFELERLCVDKRVSTWYDMGLWYFCSTLLWRLRVRA
jgi:hypothetical protein